ncbi:hypothetical protein JCM14244_16890 [Venenivibrio stagnispumantis]|uniref:Uncharacterized protein n=1 Tax=Venenivibrio stagnispumantis TaxID=407998 RepID=A0AA45WQ48_9AQUI|nr:hypothetical protein [Venenivibrio stagnispumantis]MCW4574019.1 hypothetical protein [Venenivibrio stagnispumantis]SMP23388.1 hypothetical protein SAMN06264868_1292 [Venenivibrio stagnispumantis]
MITKEVYDFIRFYRNLIEKAKKDEISIFEIKINPEDIDISGNIFQNAFIIALLSELTKLKAEYLLDKATQKQEQPEQIIKQAFKNTIEKEDLDTDDIESLLLIDSLKEKLKKPKSVKPQRISYQEFKEIVKDEIKEALHKDVDYNLLALEIVARINAGTFKIKSIKDFIGLMFAIHLYNIQVIDIKQFL